MFIFKRKKGKKLKRQVGTMENGKATWNAGVLEPVLPGSSGFQENILPPLQTSYMFSESARCFKYGFAQLVNNAALQEQYDAFREEKREAGCTEGELEESFGFLLVDDESKAQKLSETGLLVGQSSCSTLGDPSMGVYIAQYSDCLDLSPWYHGKSGYIVILRLTKGKVRAVTENYTQNFTPATVGFDCHVSEQAGDVSATTSSFLAYERTQCYVYELDRDREVPRICPRQVYPFAIVGFSYGEPESSTPELKEQSPTIAEFHYHPWRGQLHIDSKVYHIALKSSSGALLPAQLPATLKIDSLISMADLKKLLPHAVFETCFTGEVSLDSMYCSLYEVVPWLAKDVTLAVLRCNLKEKDLALVVRLNDSGFLVVLHSSYFLTYEDATQSTAETLLGMFVFPDSRAFQIDIKSSHSKSLLSPEMIKALPGLNYAETEAEKCPLNQQKAPCVMVERYLQSYATLIHPDMPASPAREASEFPDQFDAPCVLKNIYSAPRLTNAALLQLQLYFSQPENYVLPVTRVTELLEVGRDENGNGPDDDVYYCLSSPEESQLAPTDLANSHFDGMTGGSQAQTDTGVGEADHSLEAGTDSKISQQQKHQQTQEGVDVEEESLPVQSQTAAFIDHGNFGMAVASPDQPVEQMDYQTTSISGHMNVIGLRDEQLAVIGSEDVSPPIAEAANLTPGECSPTIEKELGPVPRSKAKPRRNVCRRGRKSRKRGLSHASQKGPVSNPEQKDNIALARPHLPKRKVYQYGLKSIITDCGRIFVPHGSERLAGDIKSLTETWRDMSSDYKAEVDPFVPMETVDTHGSPMGKTGDTRAPPMETEFMPAPSAKVGEDQAPEAYSKKLDKPKVQFPPLTSGTEEKQVWEMSFGKQRKIHQIVKRKKAQCPVSQVMATSGDLEEQPGLKKNEGHINFNGRNQCASRLISILQADPKLRNGLHSDTMEQVVKAEGRTRQRKNVPRRLDLATSTQATSMSTSSEINQAARCSAMSNNMELEKLVQPFKKQLKERIAEYIKGKGWLNVDTSASCLRIAQTELPGHKALSIGDRVAGAALFSATCSPEAGAVRGPTSSCQPADALTLLADLALSASGDKVLQNLGPDCRAKLAVGGGRTCCGTSSTPPGSGSVPLPDGLVVTRELALLVCKEHSYSLPPSCLLLGLSGLLSQVPASSRRLEPAPLVGRSDGCSHSPLLLAHTVSGASGQEEVEPQGPSKMRHSKASRKRRGNFHRHIVEESGVLRVTRLWKENYRFHLDSKYTNDPLDKAITRALHGPWDCRIEETFEQVHLILHMWIGLFYSRSTPRFFQTEPDGDIFEGCKLVEEVQEAAPLQGFGMSKSEVQPDPMELHLTPPSSSEPQVLDLREESKKSAEAAPPGSEVLDLSLKRAVVLDLRSVSKHGSEESLCHDCGTETFGSLPSALPKLVKPCDWASTYPLMSSRVSLIHRERRGCVERFPAETSEHSDSSSSGFLDDDDDDEENDSIECRDQPMPLMNDEACDQLCNYIANVSIVKKKGFEKTSTDIMFGFSGTHLSHRERDRRTCLGADGVSYIQPCRLTNIAFNATRVPQPVIPNKDSSIRDSTHAVVCGSDGTVKLYAAKQDINDSADDLCTQMHNGSDSSKERHGQRKNRAEIPVNDFIKVFDSLENIDDRSVRSVQNPKTCSDSSPCPVQNQETCPDSSPNPVQNQETCPDSSPDPVQNQESCSDSSPCSVQNQETCSESSPCSVQNQETCPDSSPCSVQNQETCPDSSPHPVQNQETCPDSSPDPVQNQETCSDSSPDPVQNQETCSDSSPCSVQNQETCSDSSPCSVQNQETCSDSSPCSVQNRETCSDSSPCSVQNRETCSDSSPHPVQNRETCPDSSPHPVQNRETCLDSSPHPVQNRETCPDSSPRPVQNRETCPDSSPRPVQNRETCPDSSPRPVQNRESCPDSSPRPVQNQETCPDSSPRPVQNQETCPDSSPRPVQNQETCPDSSPRPVQNQETCSVGSPRSVQNLETCPDGSPRPVQNQESCPDSSPHPVQNQETCSVGSPRPVQNWETCPDSSPRPVQNRETCPDSSPRPVQNQESCPDSSPRPVQNQESCPDSSPRPVQNQETCPDSSPRSVQNQETCSVGSPRSVQNLETCPDGSPRPVQNQETSPDGSPRPVQNQETCPDGSPRPVQNQETCPDSSPHPVQNQETCPDGSPHSVQNQETCPDGSPHSVQNQETCPDGSPHPVQNQETCPDGSPHPVQNQETCPDGSPHPVQNQETCSDGSPCPVPNLETCSDSIYQQGLTAESEIGGFSKFLFSDRTPTENELHCVQRGSDMLEERSPRGHAELSTSLQHMLQSVSKPLPTHSDSSDSVNTVTQQSNYEHSVNCSPTAREDGCSLVSTYDMQKGGDESDALHSPPRKCPRSDDCPSLTPNQCPLSSCSKSRFDPNRDNKYVSRNKPTAMEDCLHSKNGPEAGNKPNDNSNPYSREGLLPGSGQYPADSIHSPIKPLLPSLPCLNSKTVTTDDTTDGMRVPSLHSQPYQQAPSPGSMSNLPSSDIMYHPGSDSHTIHTHHGKYSKHITVSEAISRVGLSASDQRARRLAQHVRCVQLKRKHGPCTSQSLSDGDDRASHNASSEHSAVDPRLCADQPRFEGKRKSVKRSRHERSSEEDNHTPAKSHRLYTSRSHGYTGKSQQDHWDSTSWDSEGSTQDLQVYDSHKFSFNSQRPIMAVKPCQTHDPWTVWGNFRKPSGGRRVDGPRQVNPVSHCATEKEWRKGFEQWDGEVWEEELVEWERFSEKGSGCKEDLWSPVHRNWHSEANKRDVSETSKCCRSKCPLGFFNPKLQSGKREFEEALDYSDVDYSDGNHWLSHCRSERSDALRRIWVREKDEEDLGSPVMASSLVTVLDRKGNRMTYDNYHIVKTKSTGCVRVVQNTSRGSGFVQDFLQKWEELHHLHPDITQSTLDLEYLIFSEKVKQIIKGNQKKGDTCRSSRYSWRRNSMSCAEVTPCRSHGTVQFSELEEDLSSQPFLDASERTGSRDTEVASSSSHGASLFLKRLSFANDPKDLHPGISDITAECNQVHHSMMDDVCSGKKPASSVSSSGLWKTYGQTDFCGQIKQDLCKDLQENLNAVVRQSFKTKFRFYVLMTSSDGFFKQIKELLEAEGHMSVEPDEFDLGGQTNSSPLLIILRNEDIAEHACKIPHLLELRKMPNALFAGVDRPDDVLNLTHQELFCRGGFVVCDAEALDSLTLGNVTKLVGLLEELSKKGKWAWLLHYRDSRALKERARWSTDAQDMSHFLDSCQKAGMVEVLPYHECDVISQDRPDYLCCLLRLQVQHATARFPVFITDTPDDTFGSYGILALHTDTFLHISRSDTCTIL